MELKGLLLGLFFSLGIFAVKSGVGVASGIVGQRPAQTRGDRGNRGWRPPRSRSQGPLDHKQHLLRQGDDPMQLSQQGKEILFVGDAIHVMNPVVQDALERLDERPLAELARRQVAAGAGALDVNLGQGRRFGRLTPWVVQSIQEAVDVPLFLSSHVLDKQRALEVHRGRPTVNAVTADPQVLAKAMRTARRFGARLVVLLVAQDCLAVDADSRLRLAARVMETAEEEEFALRDLYLDPLLTCRPDPVAVRLGRGLPDLDPVVDTLHALAGLPAPRPLLLVSLTSASAGLGPGRRSAMHQRLLPLLVNAGIDAVLLDCRDAPLMAMARDLLSPGVAAA